MDALANVRIRGKATSSRVRIQLRPDQRSDGHGGLQQNLTFGNMTSRRVVSYTEIVGIALVCSELVGGADMKRRQIHAVP